MIEHAVTREQLIQNLDQGWYPAWFSVENGTLNVEVCCNFRLGDGKIMKLQCPVGNDTESLALIDQVTERGKSMWAKEMEELRQRAKENAEGR